MVNRDYKSEGIGGKNPIDPTSATAKALAKASTHREITVSNAEYTAHQSLFSEEKVKNFRIQTENDLHHITFNASDEHYDLIRSKVPHQKVA